MTLKGCDVRLKVEVRVGVQHTRSIACRSDGVRRRYVYELRCSGTVHLKQTILVMHAWRMCACAP